MFACKARERRLASHVKGPRRKKTFSKGPLMIQMARLPVVKAHADSLHLFQDIDTDDMDVFLDSMELLDLVNEYRHQKGLQRIEISPALMAVSFAHVKDLSENTRIPNCNMHSWSNQQPEWWAGCCYTADHAKADCMWSKGKEITSCWGHTKYAGHIYENAYSGPLSPESAFLAWKGSAPHHAVMLNSGIWARFNPWPAMGAAIGPGGYAVLIFGDRKDKSGAFNISKSYMHCGPEEYRPIFSQSRTSVTTTESTTMTSTITETTRATSTSTSRSLFRAADGGLNRACRNYAGHNSESFYRVQGDVESLDGCQQECSKFSGCTGVEYSQGRCEIWTTPIGATKELSGFSCYRYNLPSLQAVDGGADRACRGANETDNSPSYYRKYSGPTSLDACRALCATEDGCKGIEFSAGRCEVWLRAGGIGASKALAGFTCMRMP
ncbi:unnamed protein product [Durusdinium trenchii]|uniref:SCP domain-containing protein n=1 Tax=Durusdinium trenchii TaxID=1381693 RepID=A0ABP0JH80_9DINO